MTKPKQPRKNKEQREREECEATCAALSAALAPLVGFEPNVEPATGYFYKMGGGLSLQTMKAMIEGLTKVKQWHK